MVSVEEIVRDNFVVVIGGMCKGAAAVAVAQRPDAGHVRLQLIIDDYVTAGGGGDPSQGQSQVARNGSSANRQQDVLGPYFWRTFVASKDDGNAGGGCGQRDSWRLQPDVDALSLQNVADSLGDVFVLPSD